MESKKDIGKLFKENLAMMDFAPSTRVWDGIEAELKEKKKKRRILIWFFFSALLVGSLLIFSAIDFDQNQPSNHPNDISDRKTNIGSKNGISVADGTMRDKIKSESNETNQSNPISNDSNKFNASKNKTVQQNNSQLITVKNNARSHLKNTSNSIAYGTKSNKKVKPILFFGNKNKRSKTLMRTKSFVGAENNKDVPNQKSNSTTTITTETLPNNLLKSDANLALTVGDSLNKKSNPLDKEKKSRQSPKDSSTVVNAKEREYKIIISPYVGTTYFNHFGKGNTLNPNSPVVDEDRKTRLNYGILVRWMGSEKIGIQTGIGLVSNLFSTTIQKNDNNFINTQMINLAIPLSDLQTTFENSSQITFTEENQYVEVPIEGYYLISNKQFGVATAVGVSLLFNTKSYIFMEAESINEFKIGTSENSIKQSFTFNAKLHLFYTLSKRIQLDLIPEFQYHLLSHKETSNFYPYYLSLKAGISYKL